MNANNHLLRKQMRQIQEIRTFTRRILRSRYFVSGLILHVLLILLCGQAMITIYPKRENVFDESPGIIELLPSTPLPPQEQPPDTPESKPVEAQVSMTPTTSKQIVTAGESPSIAIDSPAITHTPPPISIALPDTIHSRIDAARIDRLKKVAKLHSAWHRTGTGKRTKARFTVFQASYHDGDWNCNPTALENLLLQIRRWSRGRIRAELHPEVLDIGTDELFTIKPPFVYLTGHRDFQLLDTEVRNIREYLMMGGCVWADSALAGRRSRFDRAFRREMRRVFPDRAFETIGEDHDIFHDYFTDLDLMSGMNYRREPVEVINIEGELAVLYTLNGYGHFWESRLDDNNRMEMGLVNVGTPEKPLFRHVHGPHVGSRYSSIIFRNIEDESVRQAYRFGINAVVHLLTRYDEKLRSLPLELASSRP